MEHQIMKVQGDLNDFINGDIDVTLQAIGHSHLTVSENEKFNELLSELFQLLRDGMLRQLIEDANSEKDGSQIWEED